MKNSSNFITRSFFVLCLISSTLHLAYFFLIPAISYSWPLFENFLGLVSTLTFLSALFALALSSLKRCEKAVPFYIASLFYILSYYFLKILFNNVLSTLDFLEFLQVQNNLKLLMEGNSVFYSGAMIVHMVQLTLLYFIYSKSEKKKDSLPPIKLSRTFLVGGLHSLLFILLIPAYFYFQFSYMFNCFGKGFIEIDGTEMISVQKVYQKDGREIHLIPMVHIADKNFYSKLLDQYIEKKTLILSEGVSDKDELITQDGSYNNIGKFLGLSSQKKELRPPLSSKATQLRADIDVNSFSLRTINILNAAFKLGEELGSKERFMTNYLNLQKYMGNRKTLYNFFFEILETRNISLFKLFKQNELNFNKIVIPWGALHLPGIEKRLKKLGYRFLSKKSKKVLNLWSIIENIFNRK